MTGSNGRGKRQLFSGTGVYIALFLGVTALAVAGYWTLLPQNTTNRDAQSALSDAALPAQDAQQVQMPEVALLPDESEDDWLPPAADAVESITVLDEATGVDDTVPAEEQLSSAQEADTLPVAPRLVVSPLVGETLAAFSVEELRYSETLGDWRTHDGIDIAAAAGTQVLAACSGTVTSVFDDDLMGTTVVIRHDGGYVTTYANLQSIPTVGEGQHVSAGEVIGAVGSTSLAEFASAPHLHFSVTKDGESIDPMEFLR